MTVAYLQPGIAEKYTGFAPGVSGKKFRIGSVKFSGKDGKVEEIELTGDLPAAKRTPQLPPPAAPEPKPKGSATKKVSEATPEDLDAAIDAVFADEPAPEPAAPLVTFKKAAIVPTRAGIVAIPIKEDGEEEDVGLKTITGLNLTREAGGGRTVEIPASLMDTAQPLLDDFKSVVVEREDGGFRATKMRPRDASRLFTLLQDEEAQRGREHTAPEDEARRRAADKARRPPARDRAKAASKKLRAETWAGAGEALEALRKLAKPDPNKLSSGVPLGFDGDAYEAARPHLEATWRHAKEAGESLADWVSAMREFLVVELEWNADQVRDMVRYHGRKELEAARGGVDSGRREPTDAGRREPGSAGAGAGPVVGSAEPGDQGAGREGGTGESGDAGAAPSGDDSQQGDRDQGGEPGPADGDGDGATRGRPVAPAGATGNPGSSPGDWSLTEGQVSRISARGAMARARENVEAINILKDLARRNRFPSSAEQAVLAGYVGWGDTQIGQFLRNEPKEDWTRPQRFLWERLHELTNDKERDAVRRSTVNAHFTFGIYGPIWNALERHGFQGGRVLEPAVGIGHAFGMMPATLRRDSNLVGVELEPITAGIATALYPSAKVHATGYQDVVIPEGSQDLVISNVPFDMTIFAAAGGQPAAKWPIHNYFFARALDHVRPGGMVAFITTRHTMDGTSHAPFRRELMERAEFLGAVRLPVGAFKGSARTEVITDLILLRRLDEGEKAQNADRFIETDQVELAGPKGGNTFSRSAWYTEHPEHVLGTELASGTMRAGREYNVEGSLDPAVLENALNTLLPEGKWRGPRTEVGPQETTFEIEDTERKYRPFEIFEQRGKVYQLQHDGNHHTWEPTRKQGDKQVPDQSKMQIVRSYLPLRESLLKTTTEMLSPSSSDADVKTAQKALQAAYTSFVEKHGHVNLPKNRNAFKSDLMAPNVRALETVKRKVVFGKRADGVRTLRRVDVVTGTSDIFRNRTIKAAARVTFVETPRDALWASLSSSARIDWPFMEKIAKKDQVSLQQTLLKSGDVFQTPDWSWVLSEEYLSGDVVSKLAVAEAAGERFRSNIDALKGVQPQPLEAHDVTPSLGAHWIAPQYIKDFIDHELGGRFQVPVEYVDLKLRTSWEVKAPEWGEVRTRIRTHPLSVPYGPGDSKLFDFSDLLSAALNGQLPDLKWTEKDGDKTITHKAPEATIAARENVVQLRERWYRWLEDDPDRIDSLVATFNERFNRNVLRDWKGEGLQDALYRHGLNPQITFEPHQLRAVWRGLIGGNMGVAHDVGAGKTLEAIALAMAWRKTGRARKPMIVVPKHTLSGWRHHIMWAYPGAKVLIFDPEDLQKSKRQQAMARIAFGDWDVVVVPQSSFEMLAVSNARMEATLESWISDVKAAALAQARTDKEGQKALGRIEARLRKMMSKILEGADENITWEQLGVDALMVDEAHKFKNLFFFTKMEGIKGIGRATARRSLDLYVKMQSINEAVGRAERRPADRDADHEQRVGAVHLPAVSPADADAEHGRRGLRRMGRDVRAAGARPHSEAGRLLQGDRPAEGLQQPLHPLDDGDAGLRLRGAGRPAQREEAGDGGREGRCGRDAEDAALRRDHPPVARRAAGRDPPEPAQVRGRGVHRSAPHGPADRRGDAEAEQ